MVRSHLARHHSGAVLGSIYTLLIAMAGGKKKTRSAGSPSPSPEMQPISGANPPPHEAGAAPMAVDSLEASGDPGLSAVENPDDDEAGGYPSGASDFLVKFMTTEFGRLRSAQEAKNTEIDDKFNQLFMTVSALRAPPANDTSPPSAAAAVPTDDTAPPPAALLPSVVAADVELRAAAAASPAEAAPTTSLDNGVLPPGGSSPTAKLSVAYLDWRKYGHLLRPGLRQPITLDYSEPKVFGIPDDACYQHFHQRDPVLTEEYLVLHSHCFHLGCANIALHEALEFLVRADVAETEVFDKIRRVLSGNLYIEDQLRIRLAYFRSTKGPDATEEYRLLGRVMQAKHFRPSGNEFGSDLWHQYSEDFHDLCSNSQIIASAKALARDTAKGVKPKT